jgi:hypothetical protein
LEEHTIYVLLLKTVCFLPPVSSHDITIQKTNIDDTVILQSPVSQPLVSPGSVTNGNILKINQPIFVQLNMITMALKHSPVITLFKIPTQKSKILT